MHMIVCILEVIIDKLITKNPVGWIRSLLGLLHIGCAITKARYMMVNPTIHCRLTPIHVNERCRLVLSTTNISFVIGFEEEECRVRKSQLLEGKSEKKLWWSVHIVFRPQNTPLK